MDTPDQTHRTSSEGVRQGCIDWISTNHYNNHVINSIVTYNVIKCNGFDGNCDDDHAAGKIRRDAHHSMEHRWLRAKPLDAAIRHGHRRCRHVKTQTKHNF